MRRTTVVVSLLALLGSGGSAARAADPVGQPCAAAWIEEPPLVLDTFWHAVVTGGPWVVPGATSVTVRCTFAGNWRYVDAETTTPGSAGATAGYGHWSNDPGPFELCTYVSWTDPAGSHALTPTCEQFE